MKTRTFLSILLTIAMVFSMLPTISFTAAAVTITGEGSIYKNIYTNGNNIIITAGSSANQTNIYIDTDDNGIVDGSEVPFDLSSLGIGITGNTTDGFGLNGYHYIYGGNSKITMLGGEVSNLFGDAESGSNAITSVTVKGGTVWNLYGCGASGNTNIANITIEGGYIESLYGGGYYATTANTENITISGGTVGNVKGTNVERNNTVNGDTNITISGGTVTNVYGSGGGTVTGNKIVTITGGTITNSIMDTTSLTNGSDDVYKTTLTIGGVGNAQHVSSVTVNGGSYNYGTTDMLTDSNSKVYVYLPINAVTTFAVVGSNIYAKNPGVTTNNSGTALGSLNATSFVAVSDIAGVPIEATPGINLTLSGIVAPANATSQIILWSVKDAGTTGAIINSGSNSLVTTSKGTVRVTATIVHGAAVGTNYTRNFDITVNAPLIPISTIPPIGSKNIAAGLYHTVELKADGTVWAWGANNNGQLGNGTTTDSTTAVQVSNLSNIVAIAGGGYHTVALKADGTVWAWGANNNGQLGNGTTTDSTTPVQVSNLSNIVAIAGGGYHTVALKADGTVWAWGDNYSGQLGNGTTTNSSSPVQVSNLSNIVAIAGGGYHTVALKADGTVWAWGTNNIGQLGNGTTTNSSSPVQVSGLINVATIACGVNQTVALKDDGTVWAWGSNKYGQLGNGTTTNSTTPVQVSNLSNIVAIAGGGYHTVALKDDGTVWAWGANNNGQLGNGTTTDSSSPVHVGDLTNVSAIACGINQTVALKDDGTVWTWGSNNIGQLGNNTYTNSSIPVQANTKYTVTYDANGGSGVPTDNAQYYTESTVTALFASTPTKANYTFLGWATSSTATTATYTSIGTKTFSMGSSNVTLYAVWSENAKYTVTYDANGGSGVPTDSTQYYTGNTVTALFTTAPTKANYTFVGWATTNNATTATYTSTGTTTFAMGSGNVTLYAVWSENPIYHSSGSSYVTPPTISTPNSVAKNTIVVLKPSQTNSVIYYTLDGTMPTKNSTKYEFPIILKKDTIIKYIEVGSKTSAVVTKDIKVTVNTVKFVDNSDKVKYIRPTSDKEFSPDNEATRYAVLESLYNLLAFEKKGEIDTEFADVKDDMTEVVAYFQSANIIDGFEDGKFKGEQGLTRAEFVKIMAIILKLDIKDGKSTFTDVSGHWSEKYIAEFVKLGYLKGYEDGTFKPDSKMTRAELVVIVNRIIKLEAASVPPVFTDLTSSHWAYNDIMAVYKF